jgi:hypothetical protein
VVLIIINSAFIVTFYTIKQSWSNVSSKINSLREQ